MFDAGNISDAAGRVRQIYAKGVELRRAACFGEAINAFREAACLADDLAADIDHIEMETADEILDMKNALLEIRSRALASVELIQEINGFVNADLMNP